MQPPTSDRRWQMRFAAPAILILLALADIWLRHSLPESSRYFRAWEPISLFATGEGSFRPDKQLRLERSYGDLTQLGNIQDVRQYRAETFTTDAYGFRNPLAVAELAPAKVLLLGDSFIIGAGLSDEQTLPERLRQKTGLRTYNGGTNKVISPSNVLAIVKRLRMDHGLVVHEYMPRSDLGAFNSIARLKEPEEEEAAWRKLRTQLAETFLDSPIRGLTRRAYEWLEDDRFLPNTARENVRIHSLRNGDRMLFFPLDEDSFYQSRPIDIFYWKKLREILRAANEELLVLLVPDKFSVYQPLLTAVRPRLVDTPEYLNELENALKDAGIPVLNLLPVFRREAAERIGRGSYIYWRDDTHWNVDGVDLAVEMLKAALPRK